MTTISGPGLPTRTPVGADKIPFTRASTGILDSNTTLTALAAAMGNVTGSAGASLAPTTSTQFAADAVSQSVLDFTTGTLPSGVTVARSTSGAYRIGSDGLYATVAANLPCFDYGMNGRSTLLVLPAQTNILLRSNDFANATWDKGTVVTITASATTGPDGVSGSASKIVETATSGTHNIRQSVTSATGVHTIKVRVKAAERTKCYLSATDFATGEASMGFDLALGSTFATGIGVGSWTNVKAKIKMRKNGWWDISMTATRVSGSSSGWTIGCIGGTGTENSYLGTAGSGFYVWQAQVATGDFCGHPIPTTTTSVTQNADDVVMNGTDLSSYYNQAQGTWIAHIQDGFGYSYGGVFSARADANNSIQVKGSSTGLTGEVIISSASVTDANEVTYNDGPIRAVLSYKANDFAFSVQGSTAATDATLTLPTVTELLIGKVGSSYLGGGIARLQYIRRKTLSADMPLISRPYAPLGAKAHINLAGLEFTPGTLPGTLGTHYFQPNAAEFAYWAKKGVQTVRLPTLWERFQPTLSGALDTAYVNIVKECAASAAAVGSKIIIDVHSYGKHGSDFIDSGASIASFADLWSRLATAFVGVAGVGGYDLMNEPGAQGAMPFPSSWPLAAQAATNAIRLVDVSTWIYVEGDGASSVEQWSARNRDLNIYDPYDRVIYSGHCYLDRDNSGRYLGNWATEVSNGVTDQIGITRCAVFVQWLKDKGARGHIGEIGIPSDEKQWRGALDNTLDYLWQQGVSVAFWAAGPAWSTYSLTLEPAAGVDKSPVPLIAYYATKDSRPGA